MGLLKQIHTLGIVNKLKVKKVKQLLLIFTYSYKAPEERPIHPYEKKAFQGIENRPVYQKGTIINNHIIWQIPIREFIFN